MDPLPAFFIVSLLLDHVLAVKLLPGYTSLFPRVLSARVQWGYLQNCDFPKLDYHLYNLSKEVPETIRNTLQNCGLIQSEEREKGYFE